MAKIQKAISKTFCIIICCVFALNAFSANVFSTPAVTTVYGDFGDSQATVYAFAKYEIKLRNAVYIEGGEDDGSILTDLKYSSAEDEKPEDNISWVKVKSYNGKTDYRFTITVDLGYLARGIQNFFTRTYRNTSLSINSPDEIKFYVSDNGDDFIFVGNGETNTDKSLKKTSVTYNYYSDKLYNARYIRAVFNCNGSSLFYINEFGATARGNVFRGNYCKSETYTDSQGLQYIISNGKAEIIGFTKISTEHSGAIEPCTEDFNKDDNSYTLGLGSDNEIKVISDFIGTDRLNYSGTPNNIKYIVIHNTGTVEEETDAERYNYRMHNTGSELSWHYTVDDKIIYHSLTDNIAGWHAGAEHNYESIGIEICVNGAPVDSDGNFIFKGEAFDHWVDNRFRKSLKNAAMLTAELLTRYGLGIDSVIQHHDTTDKNCPMWMRYNNGKFNDDGILWKEFLGYVKEYYDLLNGSDTQMRIHPISQIIIPDYITLYGGYVYPVASISNAAFCDAEGYIDNIRLGKQITHISLNCFSGSGIYKIYTEENESFYTDSDGILYTSNGETVYDPNEGNEIIIPNPKEDSSLNILERNGQYFLFLKNEDFTLSRIVDEYSCQLSRAYSKNGNSLSLSQIPSTCAVIYFTDGAKLTVARLGDINGDNKVNSADYALIKRQCFGSYTMNEGEFIAASISKSNKICTKDYAALKRYCFGTYDIYK